MESGFFVGKVFHQRFEPTQHAFDYQIVMLWLNLKEIPTIEQQVTGFSTRRWRPFQYKRSDYVGENHTSLENSVLNKMNELNHDSETLLAGDVFLLGQVRNFGLYFSPVNFYFLRQANKFTHMLAEVSNTPWNEKHYYLVDLVKQEDSQKAFHVSPFNPMDMIYKWQITLRENHCSIALDCFKKSKHFAAGVNLNKKEMNSSNLLHVLIRMPNMMIKTVVGIYWQALILWLKRTPLYPHPEKQ